MAEISKIITYIPTIGGNDKKTFEEGQFSVKLKAVDVTKKQAELRKFVNMDPKEMMADMMSERQQSAVIDLLKKHFVKFINFTVNDVATKEDAKADKKGRVRTDEGVSEDERVLREGDEYLRAATITDILDLGEYELAMEIFMHLIGSSQLRRTLPETGGGGGGGEKKALPTVTEERMDEEKNSESPSGTTQNPSVH